MEQQDVVRAAEIVVAARLARRQFTGLPDDCRPATDSDGYRVQDEVHRLLAPRQGPVALWKIGCTTRATQEFLGADHPCSGAVMASRVHHGHGGFSLAEHQRLGVECEIAVVLGRDLGGGDVPETAEQAADFVAGCLMAIEIVDNRYSDVTSIGVPSLVADDFFASGCVLGPVTSYDPRRLGEVTGRIDIDGGPADDGIGHDILGDPLRALAWLGDMLSRQGIIVRAGQAVLLGSITTPIWLDSPAEVTVCGTLGEVRASVR